MKHNSFQLISLLLALQYITFIILANGTSSEHGQVMKRLQQQDSKGCQLTLSLLNYDSHCFASAGAAGEAELYNLKMPLCCLQVFAGLSKLMATYTNSSNRLFLTRSEEEACFGELANVSQCRNVASKFVAGNSPCAFESREKLRERLSADNAVSFERVVEDCGPSKADDDDDGEVECNKCAMTFNSAVHLLNTTLQDESFVCAAALFVSLASTSTNNPVWSNSLYGCAQQQLSIHLAPTGTPKFSWTIIIIVIILGILGAIITMAIFWMILRKKKKSFDGDFNQFSTMGSGRIYQGYAYDDSTNFLHSFGLYTFSSEEIAKATNHFSDLLGEGSAGKVYKGILPSGQFVAVKQIDKHTKPQTFTAELVNISKVRHAHLVTLMGFCQSNDAYYLIYEYCSNGDLSKWLFLAKDDENVLSWEQRVRIAMNSARGLWFLHYYPGGSIVHRDIKPTNILLNEHMEAKLADFGLARLMEIEDYSHVITEVQGTTGYVDPEYMSMGELTLASDVYSFGVVLLQLISARRVIDLHPHHPLSLIKMAKFIAQTGEGFNDFVDPRLNGWYSIPAMLKMFRVAIACISSSRHDRLTMKEVLQNLEDVSHLSFYTMTYPIMDQDESKRMSPKQQQTILVDSLDSLDSLT